MLAVVSGQLMAARRQHRLRAAGRGRQAARAQHLGREAPGASFPDAPTLKELGYDLVQNSPFGIGAPKGTPPEVVKKLHDAFKQAMEEPSYVAALGRYDMLPELHELGGVYASLRRRRLRGRRW